MNKDTGVAIGQARAFLAAYYEIKPGEELAVTLIGEGAWSRCFGLSLRGEELAIRFGHYLDDFQSDQLANQYAAPDLPIPQVFDIGEAFDGYYAISTRIRGVPLESVDAQQWRSLVPSVVSMLEALRVADISSTSGVGAWDSEENASSASWAEHLLAVANDTPDQRTYGWRKRLATFPEGEETFAWGYDLLKEVVNEPIARCLLHCDLINRNVHVVDDRISGIFDWGCSRFGDHLYELAWFEFWGPWHPAMDMQLLSSALEERWHEIGYVPEHKAVRLLACYLHIGLDHLAYNAYMGDRENLVATARRVRELVNSGKNLIR